jgi:hypothetical protein
MAIVALVALGFGVTFELNNHAERDRLLKGKARLYREAATHLMRALECRQAETRQLPYRPAERVKLLSGDRYTMGSIPTLRSWEEEFQHHMYWGNRSYDQTQGWSEARLQALEAKLLFP